MLCRSIKLDFATADKHGEDSNSKTGAGLESIQAPIDSLPAFDGTDAFDWWTVSNAIDIDTAFGNQ